MGFTPFLAFISTRAMAIDNLWISFGCVTDTGVRAPVLAEQNFLSDPPCGSGTETCYWMCF